MKTINTEELQDIQALEPEIPIINTLPREYFEETRIPGAINIPEEDPEFADHVARAVGDNTRRFVVYCASSKCNSSEQATRKLEAAGFESVLTYKGGAEAWKKEAKQLSAK
jgi:rhodanese-related sulfurtransferase